MAKLDIIIPIYNIEAYLRKCLDSLLRQSFTDFRVLLVNDGSKDHSKDIIEEYVQKDARFVCLDKENGGLSDARNHALPFVESDYILFVDGDDYLEDNALKISMEAVERDHPDILVFSFFNVYEDRNEKEVIPLKVKDGIYDLKERPELLAYTPNAAWNKIYRTSLFLENHILYPKGYTQEDLGTTPKLLLLAGRIEYLNIPLYNYIVERQGSITATINEKIFHVIDMLRSIVTFYEEKGEYETFKYELAYLANRNFITKLRQAVKSDDEELASRFIDAVFAYKKEQFDFRNPKYEYCAVKDDRVYLNKYLCKAYYRYRRIKNG